MAKTPKAADKVNFEAALERLEKIVEELESGRLTLDDSLARYEEGVKSLKQCYELLRDAEKRVEVLLKAEDGALKTVPFEPEEDEDAGK
jgi:exodeoxyribonuclease VII small subunit